MNVLWVMAHPEGDSLTAALRAEGVAELVAQGHSVEQSDLYAMGWKATVDEDDFPREPDGPLRVAAASARAHRDGSLSPDIRAEQAKLERADAVILQFPLWWYGVPAILKGWIDRVFVQGWAYGVPDPDHPGRTRRYGDGALTGRRALVITSTGGRASSFGPRGLGGQLDQVLFPLLHGTLFYVGMTVLPPLGVHGVSHVDAAGYRDAADRVRDAVAAIATTEPLDYRPQSGDGRPDYDDDMVLRPDLAPGRTGLAVHLR